MANQLSGIAIILFIAFGSLTFILLFIFAKRQITRFALKSRHRPHYPVGAGSSKSLIKEIERRLDVIDYIRCEPVQLSENMRLQFQDENLVSQISPPHVYRMKVIDDVRELCKFLKAENITRSRHIQEDIMQYFVRLHKNNLFRNLNIQVLYKFLLLYEHARYQPEVFTYDHYCQFSELLQALKDDIVQSPKKPENPLNISKPMHSENSEEPDESAKPLLIKSYVSVSNSCSSRNVTHETAV
ncbi:protein C1orf43 homolog [Trichonephila clavipes]|nr:protein C1orf43 homolog [Trichonephila clavipes]